MTVEQTPPADHTELQFFEGSKMLATLKQKLCFSL